MIGNNPENKFFAIDDSLLVSNVKGAIEITEEEYNNALEAKMGGRKAFVRDDKLVIFSGVLLNCWNKKTKELNTIDEFDVIPETHTTLEPIGDVVWEEGWVPRIKDQEELALIEHNWVKEELSKVDVELLLHITEDRRLKFSIDVWKQYARELRDYTTTDPEGVISVTKPTRPVPTPSDSTV